MDPIDPLRDNPFHVLGLRPEATRVEVERAGQKLLGMLELGLTRAAEYTSPLGRHPRTPDLVRRALAELRDPERRLVHEVWAALPPEQERTAPAPLPRWTWPEAREALGWAPPPRAPADED